jgi:cytochrome c oxidase assembly protein subunit 15
MILSRKSIKGRVFTLLLILQSALVVTGGAVRLTGSGLGCPTWPECTPGSYTPVPNQAEGQLHAWIEFGNRLLTFALLIVALTAVFIAVNVSKNLTNRSEIRSLAIGQLLGIFGQGILGGITVLTALHPTTVALHLLVSMLLISGAASLRFAMVGIPTQAVDSNTSILLRSQVIVTAIILVIGTIVTGSGPHAGDDETVRFGLDPQLVSVLHAEFVIILTVITLIMWLFNRKNKGEIYKRNNILLLVILFQGGIGYLQYFNGLPELLVGFHLLGSTLTWIAVWSLFKSANIKLLKGVRS